MTHIALNLDQIVALQELPVPDDGWLLLGPYWESPNADDDVRYIIERRGADGRPVTVAEGTLNALGAP